MPDVSSSPLFVTAPESGMKLLRFLERRLAETVPRSALHKWIRTGQVRVNGGRAKAHSRLEKGDQVRLPPFAQPRALQEGDAGIPSTARNAPAAPVVGSRLVEQTAAPSVLELGQDLPVVAVEHDILALAKPGGLACQPGSGRPDSVAGRLAAAFAQSPFIPAPAHRLDRHTSGLVLAGLSHESQRFLHELFQKGGIIKEYLAWVTGGWPYERPCLLEDVLEKGHDASGRELTVTVPEKAALRDHGLRECLAGRTDGHGAALCAVMPVRHLEARVMPASLKAGVGATLLLVRLFTGRKHQIRVQLASRGFPIIGDGRYRGQRHPCMLLHSYAMEIPAIAAGGNASRGAEHAAGDGGRSGTFMALSLPPDWPAPFGPDPAALRDARHELRKELSE